MIQNLHQDLKNLQEKLLKLKEKYHQNKLLLDQQQLMKFLHCQSGFRPPSRIDFMAGTSSNRMAKAMISAAGNIQLLTDSSVDGENFSESQWYSFCTSFIAD